jgi:hypothetical protein
MPRSPTNSHFDRPSFLQRFRCPLETCQRLLKSKSGWTRHILLVHPDHDLTYTQSQNAKIPIPNHNSTQVLPLQKNRLYSSPPTSPMQPQAYENNYEIPQVVEVPSQSSVIPSSPLPSDEATSPEIYPTEYHAIINGTVWLSTIYLDSECCTNFS